MITVFLLILFILVFPPLEVSNSMVEFLYNTDVEEDTGKSEESSSDEEIPMEDMFTEDGSEIELGSSSSNEAEQLIDEIYK